MHYPNIMHDRTYVFGTQKLVQESKYCFSKTIHKLDMKFCVKKSLSLKTLEIMIAYFASETIPSFLFLHFITFHYILLLYCICHLEPLLTSPPNGLSYLLSTQYNTVKSLIRYICEYEK